MEYINYIVTGVFAVLFYLLRQKDSNQASQIKMLFEKYDTEKIARHALELKIASEHYPKPELDVKFLSLESATREGFKELGAKFDKFTEVFIAHITK